MLFSLVADAARGFTCGNGRLLLTLWLLGCFPKRRDKAPSEEAYRQACAKLPPELVADAARASHHAARSDRDCLYEGMRVVLADGTKIIIPRTEETIREYGLGSGSTGDAYYPQIHTGGFFDLVTGTFTDMNFDHGVPVERKILRDHADSQKELTLYVTDAGYNGMAHVYLVTQAGHHLLMELKNCGLAKRFRKSRKRSMVVEVTLTGSHLANYPEHAHLKGTAFKVRLVRTRGTTKLRSRVLITSLIDEKRFKWFDLARLYLQRWRIELAFRHLKVKIRIEHIRKCALHRIRQLLWGAIIFYNLSAVIRNKLRCPRLFPEKEQVKLHCFAFILELAESFFLAVIRPRRGQLVQLKRSLRAMRNCWFLYQPWRVRPRICQFPSSVFTRQKSTARNEEIDKCEAIREDMRILGIKYGQIEP